MCNEYQYLDPDGVYTDSQTGVMRNLGNLTTAADLLFFESAAVTKRAKELTENPLPAPDADALFAIHQHLFQDVYAWAGKKRTVEISKGGKQFFPLSHFASAFSYIDRLLAEYRLLTKRNPRQLAEKLATILDAVNFLHPFREGNGRTQREFLRVLALEKNLTLNLTPPDNPDIYARYMAGTIDGDIEKLTRLIFELITKS